MSEQLAFAHLLADVDERRQAAIDALRIDVQHWFNGLSDAQKDIVGAWFDGPLLFETWVALSAAAGDWHGQRTS